MAEIYRVLSLDGGGIRGLLTARLLARLDADASIKGWRDGVDLYAGTSTGAIMALGLAAGKDANEMAEFYHEHGPVIFDNGFWRTVGSLGRLTGAKYDGEVLREELGKVFRSMRLGDLPKRVAIAAFDLDNATAGRTHVTSASQRTWKPKIFHNYPGSDSDADLLVADVAWYSSSAPTYFPSAHGYIDGGVFANNPSMVAYAQAISTSSDETKNNDPDHVRLLSIGTGFNRAWIDGDQHDWGLVKWAARMLDLVFDGVTGIADYQLRQILGKERYHRLQIELPPPEIALDDEGAVDRLDTIANAVDLEFTQTREWLRTAWLGVIA